MTSREEVKDGTKEIEKVSKCKYLERKKEDLSNSLISSGMDEFQSLAARLK